MNWTRSFQGLDKTEKALLSGASRRIFVCIGSVLIILLVSSALRMVELRALLTLRTARWIWPLLS